MCVRGRQRERACCINPRKPGAQAAPLRPRLLSPHLSLPSPHPVWFYCGVVGSFLFILIQLVLFIDFGHSWNQRWLGKAEECDSRAWYAGEHRHSASRPRGLGLPERQGVPAATGKPRGHLEQPPAPGQQLNCPGQMEGRGSWLWGHLRGWSEESRTGEALAGSEFSGSHRMGHAQPAQTQPNDTRSLKPPW